MSKQPNQRQRERAFRSSMRRLVSPDAHRWAMPVIALVMLIGILAGCSANTDTTTADSTTAAETAEPADTSAETDTTAAETEETAEPAAKTIETLKVAFVPSREPQEIITATEPLKQLLKDELAKEGYEVVQ